MPEIHSRYVTVAGIQTHYLEAGAGPHLVLLHSGEFGACGELSWEHNIPALAEHFHVLAPDWLGFGRTEKLFSFEDMRAKRIWHMQQFLVTLGIEQADFIGNSMGGTTLIDEATKASPAWPLGRIVVVSGGGYIPDNEARKLLNGYDGTREWMRRLVESLFVNESVRHDEAYVERRHRLSLEKGAWECTAAARFRAPWREPSRMPPPSDYARIRVPILLVAGRHDNLRAPNYTEDIIRHIQHGRLHVIEAGGHCPQIDEPEEFNRVVIGFLKGG